MNGLDTKTLINEIKTAITGNMDLSKELPDDEMKEHIIKAVFEKSRQCYIDMGRKHHIVEVVFNSIRGLGILQPVLDDETVTEIMLNGHNNIFIERMGKVEKLDIAFESKEKLEDVIQSIISRANRTVNEYNPIVDARLADGSRINVVLYPIALNGPIVTIRKFPGKPLTIEQLIKFGSLTEEAGEALCSLVRARYNIFICGGTGSGKTTFLNALSNFIPSDERIITIEDSAELQITGIENIVRMETRNTNTEGKGEITIRDLIKTSLRMRPERIIVGEVRGPEALDMLQAMNTGHDGSLSTGHANSPADMLSRLETMVLTAAPLPLEAIRQQIASAIDIIIHLSRMRDKSRKVLEITEVTGYSEGRINLNKLFEFEELESSCIDKSERNAVEGVLKRTGNRVVNTYKFKRAGIAGF
ncbi:MAG: CpaF family protein [Acetivibrionales bacterium]